MSAARPLPPFSRIAIVGLGLIGGSLALAVRRRWPHLEITGVERRGRARDRLRQSLVDRYSTTLGAVADTDLVVLAGPVDVNVALIGELAPVVSARTILTDVGSTKREIVGAASRAGIGRRFVGGHPVAGTEQSGPEHARADLFDGAPWVITRGASTPRAFSLVRAFVAGVGGAAQLMGPADHDRTFAYVSHLPQAVASVLMHVVAGSVGAAGLRVSGGGLRDSTRLAASPVSLWVEILHGNRGALGPALDRFALELRRLRKALGDEDALAHILQAGATRRAALQRAIERRGRAR